MWGINVESFPLLVEYLQQLGGFLASSVLHQILERAIECLRLYIEAPYCKDKLNIYANLYLSQKIIVTVDVSM